MPHNDLVSTTTARPLESLCVVVGAATATLRLLPNEIFLDGVTYGAIARNLAEGRATFWRLRYTDEVNPFHAHPGAAPWLESFLFRLLGPDRPVELVFGAAAALAAVFTLAAASRAAARATGARAVVAWPVLLLLCVPVASWCWANNMLENVLLPASLAAVALTIDAVAAAGVARQLASGVLAGALLALGLLTKGPPALFVLVALPLAPLTIARGRWREAARVAAAVGVGLALALALAVVPDPVGARAFAAAYVREQLLPSMAGARELATSRWDGARWLLSELGLPALVVGSAFLLVRSRVQPAERDRSATRAVFFAAIACAGTAPFLLFAKQMRWYLLPGLGFWVLALASATEPVARALGEALSAPRPRRALVGLAALAVLASGAASVRSGRTLDVSVDVWLRDAWRARVRGAEIDDRFSEYDWRHFRRDILAQAVVLPAGEPVAALASHSRWRLIAFAQRYLGATVTTRGWSPHLIVERLPGDPAPSFVNCRSVQRTPPVRFFVFECTP
jgi:4-amino-4-deoxy-L-arabinose transferase-like glycosyltransferase